MFNTGSQDFQKSNPSRDYLSLRTLKYVLCWLLLWQDGMVGGSAFQILENLPIGIPGLSPVPFFTLLLAFVVVLERTLTRDFTLKRSDFGAPLLLMLLAFFISWCRGSLINQRVTIIYEIQDAFSWPFEYFVILNAFRDPEEGEVLWKILILAVLPKAVEGMYIYFFSSDDHKNWGVVQDWRDGFLLGIGAISTMLFLHYRGTALLKVRKLVLLGIPFLGFTFIMSYRRTFMLGALVSALAMFVTLPRVLWRRQVGLIFGFLLILVFFGAVTNPLGVLARLSGVVDPQHEGSAYIRLMEYPNVFRNIIDNPIWGTPVGTEWKVYYRMPASSVYTTLGTHNAYLYWPLRGGILGTVAFFWLFFRLWKSALINNALGKSKEDFFFGQFGIHLLILYQFACFFGLLYGGNITALLAVMFTAIKLTAKKVSGCDSYRSVDMVKTLRSRQLVLKEYNTGNVAAKLAAMLAT